MTSAPSEGMHLGPHGAFTLLYRVEGALHAILIMLTGDGTTRSRVLVEQGSMVVVKHTQVLLTPTILANPGYAEYAKNTADRFEELESFTAALNQQI